MSLEVGSKAPEFSLKNQSGEIVSLSDFNGKKNVLVMFYPFAFSGICTGEICEINEDLPKFQNEDVEMISISCDPHHALRAFAEKENIKTILLSDFWPHGAVAKAYGVFLEDLGLEEPGASVLIRAAYKLLNQQTYFTAGVKEVRAWTINVGDTAPQAAGVIHTDFEKGFIRAEVIAFEDYVKYGTEAKVKEAGKFRVEGKEYIVKDGDVMHFRFNV